jgi:hypothetical protein
MTKPNVAIEELSDSELAIFINNISKELADMAKERGLHTLIPSLRSTTVASENVLKKINERH